MAKQTSLPPSDPKALHDYLETDKMTDRALVWMLAKFMAPFWPQLILVLIMLAGVTVLTVLLPYLVKVAVDGPITSGDLEGLIPFGIIYFVAIVVLFVLRFSHIYLLQTVGQTALVNLRQTLFEHILRQDMRFFNHTAVGQLVSRLSNDIDALTEMVSTSFIIVISNMITLAGIIIVMFALNWRLALFGLATLPVMTAVTVFFRRRLRRASSKYHRVVAEFLAFMNEQFGGMLVVQLFERQAVSRREFEVFNTRHRDVHMEIRDNYTLFSSALQMLTTIGFAIVLYGGGQGVLAGWATLGTLIAFVDYTRRSFEPVLQLSEQFAQIQTALAAGERIGRMLRVQPGIQEAEHPVKIENFKKTFQFDHVSFGYEPGHLVLRDVDFQVEQGQRIAIVGATGAGKTSLAGLLARFYDVNEGAVRLDGVDVREIGLSDLRHYVTVVPQNPYCFNGTIRDNLKLFNEQITDEQMIEAARVAHAAPFIDKLPEGYDYMLLPGGANLSQGQRQLLALARALLHNPDSILVLDEATSNIDTETEALLQAALQAVLQNRTSLIIAHRLSTIRESDRILVMQRGQIIEDGNHEELLRRNGLYAALYRRQFAEKGLEGGEQNIRKTQERMAVR
jgi:ATP-binding cassette subfamily B multidrug efflux pump